MTNQAQGRRKSNFPAATTVPSGSYFDYVYSGVNYRITDTDFYAELGVTGTIVQLGDGVNVLDTQGSVNRIRDLEYDSNSGIKVSVSVNDGLYLELDAASTGTGIAVINSSNEIRRILAGSGISASLSGDDIVISASSTPAAKRGVATMAGNSTATTLSVSTPTKFSGTFTAAVEDLFTVSTAGRLTYVGTSAVNVIVQATVDVTKAGAGSDTYVVEVYKNGSQTGFRTKFATDANWSASLCGALQLVENDYLELYVTDTTSGNDITLNDANFMVFG